MEKMRFTEPAPDPIEASGSQPEQNQSLPDAAAMLLILSGFLLWYGFTGKAVGSVMVVVRRFLEQTLGSGRFIFVIILLASGVVILINRHTRRRIPFSLKRTLLVGGMFLALMGMITTSAFFSGGELGNWIFAALERFLGPILAYTFLAAVLFGCFIALFDVRPIWGTIKSLYRTAVDKLLPTNEDAFSVEAKLYRANHAIEELKTEEETLVGTSAIPDKLKPTEMRTENEQKEMIKKRTNQLPPLNLLDPEMGFLNKNIDVQSRIDEIEEAMDEFGTPVVVTGYSIGPAIIQYQVTPGVIEKSGARGATLSKNIRVAQVAQMERDLAVRLGVANLSIQAPVPGESFIGIDLPNPDALKVRLRPLIESPEFQGRSSPLAIALGRDISGIPVVVDLEQMPHLLVAGTTNSGKSICLRSMAICLILNNTPDQLKLVMIDPKRVELFRFNGLPHLLGKVETEYERSIAVLGWAVEEMKNRYRLFESVNVRKLSSYNVYAQKNGLKLLPYIVIFIDELSEIMKGADKMGQEFIDTLASLARATGMHLVVATQRPDTTIITGKIKTNIPARIAMNVASAVDSRVIMGKQGAEKLLGRGDMYFVDPSVSVPIRIQGPLLTDQEIDNVVSLWKKLEPKPKEELESSPWDEIIEEAEKENEDKDDKVLKEAIRLVCRTRKASAANLQGRLGISFPRASRLLDRLEKLGVVGPIQLGGKSREVLWSEDEADSYGTDAGFKEDE